LYSHRVSGSFSNDAGRSAASALYLGKLHKLIKHFNEFYTFFDRKEIIHDGPDKPGTLIPNFQDQNPNPSVQSDFYTFYCTAAVQVHLFTVGPWTKVTYILSHGDGHIVVSGDEMVQLVPGRYTLQVVDGETQVTPSGQSHVTFRRAQAELFEAYQFEILIP
jgi:hypothetical protein